MNWSDLVWLIRVQAGEEVIIGKAGKPAAVLRSYQSSSPRRRPGSMRGKIRIAPDFDDLPEDLAEAPVVDSGRCIQLVYSVNARREGA